MLNFTDEERRVFLFLALLLLSGVLVNFFLKIHPCAAKAIRIAAEGHIAKVNLNTVDYKELCDIPGVSEGLARNIIASRDRKGGFTSLEELKEVKGIGRKRYEKLKDSLYIRP